MFVTTIEMKVTVLHCIEAAAVLQAAGNQACRAMQSISVVA